MTPRFAGRVRKRSRGPGRPRVPVLLLALGALVGGPGGTPAARAEETAEARYARELLLAEADRAVRVGTSMDLEGPRTALRRDQALVAAPPGGSDGTALAALRRTIAARELLVGRPAVAADGSVTWSRGALTEAADLLRWVLGQGECAVRMAPAETAPGRAPSAGLDLTWPPPEGAAAEAEAPPDNLEAWAAWARQRAGGSLLAARIEAVTCTPLTELQAATTRLPPYLPPEFPSLPHAKVDGEGAAFLVNEPLLRLRSLQSAERVDAFSQDVPVEGLVDESAVREKALRADALEEQLVSVRARRDAMAAGLLEMATVTADAWRGILGALAEQIEVAKAAAPEAADADLKLRALVAQENAAVLEQRLFYLSALRLAETVRRMDRWITLLENEVLAARGAEARFSDALVRARRERQLVRLQFERNVRLGPALRSVGEEVTALEKEVAAPPAGGGVPPATRLATARARRAALEALLAVNEVVLEAVRRRGAVGERANPPPASAPAREDVPGAAASSAKGPADGSDALAALRSPETSSFDAAYVKVARERLGDPTQSEVFDADLVARHHAAVDERLAALRAALKAVSDVAPLQDRYAALATAAEARIQALAQVGTPVATYYARVYRQKLEMHGADFADAFKGIEAERGRLRERIASLDAYRAALLAADGRNYAIRVRRALEPEALARSARATDAALGAARRWLAFEGEDHLGTFVRDRWAALLGLAGAAVGLVLLVRHLRRLLDLGIERGVARRVPVVSGSGGMQEERERAHEQKAQAEEATRAIEEAVLGQAEPARSSEGPPAPGTEAAR